MLAKFRTIRNAAVSDGDAKKLDTVKTALSLRYSQLGVLPVHNIIGNSTFRAWSRCDWTCSMLEDLIDRVNLPYLPESDEIDLHGSSAYLSLYVSFPFGHKDGVYPSTHDQTVKSLRQSTRSSFRRLSFWP